MIAHAQLPLCLPLTRPPFLRCTGPPLWAPPSPVLSFLRHGNVVTFGAVSYGTSSVICLYVYQVIALKKWLAEVYCRPILSYVFLHTVCFLLLFFIVFFSGLSRFICHNF